MYTLSQAAHLSFSFSSSVLISWDKAYCIANNKAALCKGNTDYWADQMESLGCDAAEHLMAMLGYTHGDEGIFIKPGETKK